MIHTTVFKTAEFISVFEATMLEFDFITNGFVLLREHCKICFICLCKFLVNTPFTSSLFTTIVKILIYIVKKKILNYTMD